MQEQRTCLVWITAVLGLAYALAEARPVSAQSDVPDGFEDSLVVSGLYQPTSLAVAGDGRLFVAEKQGQLRVVRGGELLAAPFLSVPVNGAGERGLLGVALDPLFARNGQVYVYYTHETGTRNRVSRFTTNRTNPDVADPASERVLLDGLPASHYHNAGALHFAADGTLLVAVGDTEMPALAQSLDALAGKILRIDPASGRAPTDNPFTRDPGARPEIWALGLRNPFSFAVEPGSGKILINDVGVARAEEVNLGGPGVNYGWPDCEGPCPGSGDQPGDPIYYYGHSKACAITGASFAGDLRFPAEFAGDYFFSDFCGRWIMRLTPQGEALTFARNMNGDAVDLDVGPDGSLLYLSHGDGAVRQIEFVGAGNRKPVAVATAYPAEGPAPLAVVLAANDSKDPDDDPLSFEWDAGDGSPITTESVRSHSYARDGAYTARVTVSDGRGGRATAGVAVRVGRPPIVRILAPLPGATFKPGEVLRFEGVAEDPDDGPLPPSALVWNLELHHHPESDPLHHTHPLLGPVVGSGGSFQLPETLHDDDIWVRVWLSAADSTGLDARAFVDVTPTRD